MRRVPWIAIIVVLSAITLLFRLTPPNALVPLLLNTGFGRNASHTPSICNTTAPTDRVETQRNPAGEGRDTHITKVIAHINGFTVLENIYLKNGTLFVVHNDSASLGTPSQASGYPLRKDMLSKNVKLRNGTNFHPTDEEMSFVRSSDTNARLGSFVQRIRGVTVLVYDSTQFLGHLYHWWGEIILGSWRIYSTINQSNVTHPSIPYLWSDTHPMRFILPFSENGGWRDHAGLDGPLIRATFPSASVEESGYWADLKVLDTTVVFDRLVLVNRHSAHSHPYGGVWFKMIAGAATVNVTKGFWEPLRQSLVKGLLGYVPPVGNRGAVLGHDENEGKPLVTYVSRQNGTSFRKLANVYHESLVSSLKALENEGVIKFHEAHFERMTIHEQVELAAKTTIMIGPHGNGLTHQLWMPPSPWSTVMEILRPKAYVFDYEMLARNVGHRHYAVWNDTLVTYPEGTYYKGINYAEDFHGKDLPVWGPAVAQVIRERLTEQH